MKIAISKKTWTYIGAGAISVFLLYLLYRLSKSLFGDKRSECEKANNCKELAENYAQQIFALETDASLGYTEAEILTKIEKLKGYMAKVGFTYAREGNNVYIQPA